MAAPRFNRYPTYPFQSMADDDLDFGETIRGLAPGQRVFDRYELKEILGRGGMGIVWRAYDETLRQDIAIKMLPEMVAADDTAIRELQRETARSQKLSHPHILRIYDFAEAGRSCGITMELVEGGNLAQARLKQDNEVFDVDELKVWVEQLCQALEYAHGKAKVVHRDLKPANLMVDEDGDLKIADFGIAASVSESVSRVSQQAGSSGTPLYMSPQQIMGQRPAVTDDIYALGATLYELLVGKPPFFSGQIVMQVLNAPVPELNEQRQWIASENGKTVGEVPAAWVETIIACLAKEPTDRPQSAKEVWACLKGEAKPPSVAPKAEKETGSRPPMVVGRATRAPFEAATNSSDSSTSTAPHKSNGGLWIGLAAAAVALVAAGWWFGIAQSEGDQDGPEDDRPVAEKVEPVKDPEPATAKSVVSNEPVFGERFEVEGLAIAMVPIEPGTFMMGSPEDEEERQQDERQHRVTLTQPFWLGATEVTQAQWQAFMGSNPSHFAGAGGDAPVEEVSWNDVIEFCRKLTDRERATGRLPEGYVYTLPTEAQWEYACRAGSTGKYAGDLDATGWYESNSNSTTHRVGQKRANAWGLYDMHGNVWEWCLDLYGAYPSGRVSDPHGSISGHIRVLRGGGWHSASKALRSAERSRDSPEGSSSGLGFRVALAPEIKSVEESEPERPVIGEKWTVPELDIAMVPIEPGTFMMGSPADELGRDNDELQHRVTLTQSYWLGEKEVTQGQWQALMGSNPSRFTNMGRNSPVEPVSWNDAMEYCRKLTEREGAAGRLPKGYVYTLPTEAQWEYACRAGTAGAYAGNLDAMGWYSSNSDSMTHPVGQKRANAWGLYDMHGNVWEWCLDWYGYYPSGNVTDPDGPDSGTVRVFRGGSWSYAAKGARSASRLGDTPGNRYNFVTGFRVALAPVQ